MFKVQKLCKHRAQAIIEGLVAFILVFLIFVFIVEFALYFQNIHANQTLSDDISANIATLLYDDTAENFCAEPQSEALEMIENRAQRYINKNIWLDVDIQSDNLLVLKSTGNEDLTINIICSNTGENIVRSEYVYKGFLLFRFGHPVSSISSVQTPKF